MSVSMARFVVRFVVRFVTRFVARFVVLVMLTTMRFATVARIGPSTLSSHRQVEPALDRVPGRWRWISSCGPMRLTVTKVYGQLMRFIRSVRRDVRVHAWDYALGGALIAVAIVALITRIDVQDADAHLFRPDTWWGWALTIGACATVIARRRTPLRALASGLLLVVLLEFAHQRDTVAFFSVVIVLYSVASNVPLKRAGRAIALIVAFYAALIASGNVALAAVPALGVLFLVAGFAFGLLIRHARTRQERDARRAIELAATATLTSELDAADERLRTAQELHDIVAHSLSVIAVQAGIGAHLVDREPIEATRALHAIRTTCDTTSIELDRLVDILRNGTAPDTTPAPSLAAIATVIEQIRNADLAITLITEGDLAAVPAGVSLAAYRIVQEALTNTVRHAGHRVAVTVTIQATVDHINLTIDDDGRGSTHATSSSYGSGNGLVGMKERASIYGGDVHTGPRPGGGFRVRATLDTQSGAPMHRNPTQPHPGTADATDRSDRPHDHRRFSASTWDAALAALMALIATLEVFTTHATSDGPHFTPSHIWAIALRLGSSATLAFRRRHSTLVYGTAWILNLALTIGDYQVGVLIFVLWIGFYSVAAYATTGAMAASVIGTIAGITIIAWSKPPDLTTAGAVWASVFFAAAAIAGQVVRHDRDRRTTDLATRTSAAAARTRHARLVLTNERLRIADELSTVITRSIDTIARHVETGSQHVDNDTTTAREALQTISTISRDALNDLRRLLRHLRTANDLITYAPLTATSETAEAGADLDGVMR